MKFIPEQIDFFLHQHNVKRNLILLGRFIILITALILLYSVLFHFIMLHEGQRYSWISGVYWTLTVMSTLGFGDITFTSDLGKFFTIIVLCSGVILLIIILPFAFIQFFYAPWIAAQEKGRTPRSIPAKVEGHVLIASTSPIALDLASELRNYGALCYLICWDSVKTLDLIDQGYNALVGEHDASETYINARLQQAAMLVTLENDVINTNIIFTARDVSPSVPIVASVQSSDAIDILKLAGATKVFQFHQKLGRALARRVLNINMRFSVLNTYKELRIAEGPVMRTSLVGKSIKECGLRNATGANVVGIWERGKFVLPTPEIIFTPTMVAVIVGNHMQIEAANAFLGKGQPDMANPDAPIVIIGGGRVGKVAAENLEAQKRNFNIVDKNPKLAHIPHMIIGDAADLDILKQAGIYEAPSVLITTHDDDTNIYLTLYCRRLREDIQIISRATLDRNVGILHAAGADLVLSLASMVSSIIINLLSPGKVIMINEGLNIFRAGVDKSLVGQTLIESNIRKYTNCSVVAIKDPDGVLLVNPDPSHVFKEDEELLLIGDSSAEKAFYEKFGNNIQLT